MCIVSWFLGCRPTRRYWKKGLNLSDGYLTAVALPEALPWPIRWQTVLVRLIICLLLLWHHLTFLMYFINKRFYLVVARDNSCETPLWPIKCYENVSAFLVLCNFLEHVWFSMLLCKPRALRDLSAVNACRAWRVPTSQQGALLSYFLTHFIFQNTNKYLTSINPTRRVGNWCWEGLSNLLKVTWYVAEPEIQIQCALPLQKYPVWLLQ